MRPDHSIEVRRDDGVGLRVTFVRIGDRFGHTVQILDDERAFPILATADCCEDSNWPPSPPLQQLTIETRRSDHVGLLVGMAGTSHWSASIETSSAQAAVIWDVACLASERPERLGCAYRSMITPLDFLDPRTLTIHTAIGLVRFESLSSRELADAIVEPTEDGFNIRVTPSEPSCPTTIRWKYRASFD